MTATTIVHVPLGARAYDVLVGRGLLARAGELLAPVLDGPEAVVVTDSNLLATDLPGRLGRGLEAGGIRYRTVVVPAGEASKSMERLAALLDAILEGGADRRLAVVALGGGMIGDLAGLAAALLLRGVPFVQVPTSLLAQVDSSVGGKTGVNSRFGKNLVGAFWQPRRVLVDVEALESLPRRELLAGYAELVKHAFIKDASLFAWLEAHAAALLAGDPVLRAEAIARSVAIKAAVVAADERETGGERALLNFGHTFAHAYETLTGYGAELLHGEAVALGMAQAFALSTRLGRCPAEDAARAIEHLAAVGLPTRPERVRKGGFPVAEVLALMRRDKKATGGRLTFVLARGIGRAELARDVPEAEVAAFLADAGRAA
ncbi:MAG: 3-dehydroquinate synthase [Geminicoccaceae bacterium]|nr:3-dehydroquinate synthase [Geminicoccaceae bacterium]MCX8100807.1 3-dehydroquinate synthase [Geminicoccaceae bacterium]MDW8370046.1 3-dehydroquinate synthase [Geminicoccaceae bacterium]